MRPLIGITGRRFRLSLIQGADERYGDRCIDTAMSDFATRIAEAGGLPVHLSYDTDPEAVCGWLGGVVITGGQDMHPACWGGDSSVVRGIDPRTDPMVHDRERDDYEVAVVRAALDRGIPVLGVCRGLQVLNVALGGTLVADLPAGPVSHLSPESAPTDGTVDHLVSFEPGSISAGLFDGDVVTNSWHHQAVDRCGVGVVVTGRTSDGVVEAIEVPGHPVLGVQWHPEWMKSTDPTLTWVVREATRLLENEEPPVTRRPVVAADQMAADPTIPTLTALLAQRAADSADREFLRFGEWSWTFAEIDAWTSRLAHRLIEVDGVRPGDRVAIMLPNVVHWPVGWLAVLKAGAVAVPVNCSYQRADLAFVLRDSGARVVLTDAERAGLVAEVVRDEALEVDVLDVADDGSEPFPATAPDRVVDGGTLANLQYTSGTTGFPKACMLTHDYWVRLGWLCSGAAGLGSDDVLLTAQPFSYMDPQWNTAVALTTGAPLVVLPRFSASTFMADVRRHRATFVYVLGSMPTLLFKQPSSPDDRDNALRAVFCSAIPVALHDQLEERWGAPWREVYGMTESGIDLFSPFDDTAAVGSGSLGHPVPSKRVRVVDPADPAIERPDGESGELVVSGAPLMSGYWNRPEATANTIRDGWLHTGDLVVRRPDGGLQLVGRIKDMVRRGGENVACAEVEAALERDDLVVGAAVIAVPDAVLGEEVKAFLQLRTGVPADRDTAERILEAAGAQLARFKVPRYVEFVADFPRTPSERVSKPALKTRAAEQPGTTHDFSRRRS